MINFPHNPFRRTAPAALLGPVRSTTNDVLWNKPVFKAPALQNPAVALEPLPFQPARVTRRARQTA